MPELPPIDGDSRRHTKRRPDAVAKLGLQLPVTEQDVKQAYRRRAQETHPDHGGSVGEFLEVQRAFEEAVEFAKRNGKRLPWIGAQMPVYLATRDAIDLIDALGGRYELHALDWLADTVGSDFASMADQLKSVDLSGTRADDDAIARLTADAGHLPALESLVLANTAVTDAGAIRLTRLPSLRRLDLRGTKVSFGMRKQLARHDGIEHVEGVSRLAEWLRRGS
ncbi:MAG: hypothetical protein AAF805_11185 [Planctomycetota bacterium]